MECYTSKQRISNYVDRSYFLTFANLIPSSNTGLDSIFFDNERTLFAFFEYTGKDFEQDMAKMKANAKVREWWDMTDSMQVWQYFASFRESIRKFSNVDKESLISGATGSADGPGWWKDLDEVFHVD